MQQPNHKESIAESVVQNQNFAFQQTCILSSLTITKRTSSTNELVTVLYCNENFTEATELMKV